ncbi:hypothetical protein DPEC_G00068100 [Dallia pectoralis]|uniref:Uncharacterized protein n=1 Tax=Dallia pectoralis TaxID=75939 RepID=A0ACC2H1Q9_DALPE|nr:hypothetical protein DPEC_G00068100 [Dallia pectoralis]
MSSGDPELCSQVCCDPIANQKAMKAFWLTLDGRLVYVNRLSEDIKFRRIRQQNVCVALSLWTTNPELCGHMMRASGSAHANLIEICGEAAHLSQGMFYNLYANYPLPIHGDGEPDVSQELLWLNEKDIDAEEIRTGRELLLELQPLYVAYFGFAADHFTSIVLRERVSLLGARWLLEDDRSELQFSLDLRRNWFTRMAIRLALFLVTS